MTTLKKDNNQSTDEKVDKTKVENDKKDENNKPKVENKKLKDDKTIETDKKDENDKPKVDFEVKSKKKKKYNGRLDGRRNKKSVFHIVVNTNKSFMEYSNELKKADTELQRSIEKLFYDSKNYEKILKINPNDRDKYKGDTFSPKYIKKIEFNDYCTEIGDKMHRLHAHIMITVRHITLVHINQGFLTNYFNKVLGLKGAYVHVKNVASTVDNLKEYISGHNLE